jgi:hypothetical protein
MEGLWIAVATAALTAAATGGINLFWARKGKSLDTRDRSMDDIRHSLELLKKANQMVLRDRLWQICKSSLKRGYCPQNEKAQVRDMYEVYHSLGANGVMDKDVEKLYELPTEPEQEE